MKSDLDAITRANIRANAKVVIKITQRASLATHMDATKKTLQRRYGINPESLSLIEQAYLNRIILECKEYAIEDNRALYRAEITQTHGITEIEPEAASRWLLELYGLPPSSVYDLIMIDVIAKDRSYDEHHVYLRGERELAEDKFNELVRKYPGHKEETAQSTSVFNAEKVTKTIFSYSISQTMKEYIARTRDEAHLI